jgi:hypothetical protein
MTADVVKCHATESLLVAAGIGVYGVAPAVE